MANSPKQIKNYVQECWQIQLKGTDEKSLMSIKHKEARELFEVILYYRRLQKSKAPISIVSGIWVPMAA